MSERDKGPSDGLNADGLSAATAPASEKVTQLAEKLRKSQLSRRAFLLRSGGALGGLALGMYLKPSLTSLGIPPAFASVSPGQASINWGDGGGGAPFDDIQFDNEYVDEYTSATQLDVTAGLCNVSDDEAGCSAITFTHNIVKDDGGYLAAVDPVVIANEADFKDPNLLCAPDCRDVNIQVNFNAANWGDADDETEVKFRIIATADQSGQESRLTVTVIKED